AQAPPSDRRIRTRWAAAAIEGRAPTTSRPRRGRGRHGKPPRTWFPTVPTPIASFRRRDTDDEERSPQRRSSSSLVPAAWPRRAGYGLLPIRPVHSTLLNCAGGTWSASEKSNPAVTLAQYSASCLGLMFGPRANLTSLFPSVKATVVVARTVDASA